VGGRFVAFCARCSREGVELLTVLLVACSAVATFKVEICPIAFDVLEELYTLSVRQVAKNTKGKERKVKGNHTGITKIKTAR